MHRKRDAKGIKRKQCPIEKWLLSKLVGQQQKNITRSVPLNPFRTYIL